MSCDIVNKWQCTFCPLKNSDDMEVIKCVSYDSDDVDYCMPIQVTINNKRKQTEVDGDYFMV